MSSAGINPLAIIAPDLYSQQIAIQQRQALAQALLQSGSDPGKGGYGGLRSAGNSILGAILAKRANSDMAGLYAPQQAQTPAPNTPETQISNNPGSGPVMAPQTPPQTAPAPAQPNPNQALGQALQQPQGQATPSMQPMPQPQPQMQQQPRSIPQAMASAIPDLPGMTHQQSMLEYFQDPQDYWKAIAPTPEYRNALQAAGGNTNLAAQLMLGQANKASSATLRPGGGSVNYADGQVITMPNTNGVQTNFPQGINGPTSMNMVPGAAPALANSAMATNAGNQAVRPFTGYDASGMPVATNNLAMTGNPAAQNLIPGVSQPATQSVESGGNPNAISPAGARGPMQTMPGTLQQPGFGVQPAQNGSPQEQGRVGADYQSALMAKYKNPVVATIAYNMGPGATDKWLAAGGDFSALPEETQKYLGRIAVAQAIPQRQQQPAPQAAGSGLMPALPASQGPYMAGQGKDASDRHDAIVAAASESPMRINVLDNIIKLSSAGVQTGPGSEWQASMKGYIANTPGLGKLLGSTQQNVGNFQELQKFMYQNALRNWQAAGGTGTDSQLESAAKANPNDHLFPQALQTIAKWGKAAELAVQGKANAQDQFLAARGQTPQNQIQFESQWRNSFDPKVFQYSLMSPQEKQNFAATELKTPQAAQAFIAKQKALQGMGALQ